MSGIRFSGSVRRTAVWVSLIAVSILLNHHAISNDWTLSYLVVAWTLYYVGNTLILGTPVRKILIRYLGETRAWGSYQVFIGVMFLNQALGLASVSVIDGDAMSMVPSIQFGLGAILLLVGFSIKFWATRLVGLDIYYYKDLFLGRPLGTFSSSGP
ncbi:hypothetical protein ACFL17_06490 [Pseudomonadota bacterium]